MKPHHAGRMILQGLKSACAFCRRAAQSIAADTRVRSAAPYVPLLAVLLGTALLYLPVLSADFVTFDDNAYVVENPDLRTPNLAQILDPRHLTVSDWTPVVTVSHVAEYQLFGLAPAAYHATNLLLHLGCILLVYVVLSDLQIGRLEAVLGALIFAIHPLQVESVAWVASRKNLLAALFGLAFLHTFLTGRGGRALVLLAVALGSKGTAVVFPVWAMVAAWLGFGTIGRRRAARWLLPFALLIAVRVAISAIAQRPVVDGRITGNLSLGDRMAIMGPVLVTQLRQFFAPYDLCLRYAPTWSTWTDPFVLGCWALLAGVVVAVGWAARDDRRLQVAALLSASALLPTMNIVAAPEFQADRYLHLALVGAPVLAVALLRRVQPRIALVAVLAWSALVLVPAARARIAVWRDAGTLWTDTLEQQPQLAFGWAQLARYYRDSHDLPGAERALRRTLELAPGSCDTRFNLGLVLLERGAFTEAQRETEQLLTLCPDSSDSHRLMASIRAGLGDHASP